MLDREKVIKGLEYCKHTDGVECPNCPYWHDDDCVETLHSDILALLKEQEHKDKLFHALEDDWKRLKELLKEQEAVKPEPILKLCPLCGSRLMLCDACAHRYGDFKDDCDYCTETDSCRFSRKKDWWKEE